MDKEINLRWPNKEYFRKYSQELKKAIIENSIIWNTKLKE